MPEAIGRRKQAPALKLKSVYESPAALPVCVAKLAPAFTPNCTCACDVAKEIPAKSANASFFIMENYLFVTACKDSARYISTALRAGWYFIVYTGDNLTNGSGQTLHF